MVDESGTPFTLPAVLRAAVAVRTVPVLDALRAAFADEDGRSAFDDVEVRGGSVDLVGGPDEVVAGPVRIARAGGVITFGDGTTTVVLTTRAPVPALDLFLPLAVSALSALSGTEPDMDLVEAPVLRHAAEMERTIGRLRDEVSLVDFLQSVGRKLTSQLDIDALVQEATDAATQATRAAFGAFFYNLVNQYGESYTLYTLAGVSKAAFEGFPMPRNTEVFAPTFHGTGTVRSDDIRQDPRYGKSAPHHGTPPGHLPVRSYLAVPVISPTSGEVLGGFFFGHPEPGRFTARHEQLAEGIAGYSAIALDNARLLARHRSLAVELARSMQPLTPSIPGLSIVSRYLPAAMGSDVGGDWFDVVVLPAGRTGLVIGDVVGRGVGAATIMGQIRAAVRSYALLDLPPADVMRHACKLADTIERDAFITCLYAVIDPTDDTITVSNAGHLPAILHRPGAEAELFGGGLGMPLGVGHLYAEQTTSFPPGAALTLFTDGLVETRSRGITEGMAELVEHLGALTGRAADDLDAASDALISGMTGDRHDDDVAFLHVRNSAALRRGAALPLGTAPTDVAKARAFVTERLAEWDLAHLVDAATLITSELVTNAIMHADRPAQLRVHHDGIRLVIDVADDATAWPQVHDARPDEENHRGLAIVRALATRWGARTTTAGKVVWAEIADPTP